MSDIVAKLKKVGAKASLTFDDVNFSYLPNSRAISVTQLGEIWHAYFGPNQPNQEWIPLTKVQFEDVAVTDKDDFDAKLAVLFPNAGTSAGSSTPEEITLAALQGLAGAGTIEWNKEYLITDSGKADKGIQVKGRKDGRGIFLSAIAGHLNPDWQGAGDYSGVVAVTGQAVHGFPTNQGLWTAGSEADVFGAPTGCVRVWNNLHYQVIRAADYNGTSPDNNPAAYMLLPKSAPGVGYIEDWDNSEYDLLHDWIVERRDKRGNRVRVDYITATGNFYWDNVNNPFVRFKWGSDVTVGNTVENAMCDIRNVNFSYRFKTINPNMSTFDVQVEFLANGVMAVPAYGGLVHVTTCNEGENICNSFDTAPSFPRKFTVSPGCEVMLVFTNEANIKLKDSGVSLEIDKNDLDFVVFTTDYLGNFVQTGQQNF